MKARIVRAAIAVAALATLVFVIGAPYTSPH
jgi:hypothetical protein